MVGKITIVSNQYRMLCFCLYQKAGRLEGVEVVWDTFDTPASGPLEDYAPWVASYFADLPAAGSGHHLSGQVTVIPFEPSLMN